MSAAYIGRGLAADQLRPGAVSDQRGIQRVVEMRVHWDDGRQLCDADARQASVDPGRRRRDLAHADPAQTGPGEETVGHHCRGPVVDQQRRYSQPRHRQRSIWAGDRHAEAVRVPREIRPPGSQPHQQNAFNSMPAVFSRSATADAICTAPGESPWTQTDFTYNATVDPSTAVTFPSTTIPSTRSAMVTGSCSTAPGSRRDTSWPSGR